MWLQRRHDHLRRATLLEPRGRPDLVGALLTEPVSREADAGLIFLDASGYPVHNISAVIATATVALEHGLMTKAASTSGVVPLAFDTPGGLVHVEAECATVSAVPRVTTVRVSGAPSFVAYAGCAVTTPTRSLRVDLAFGGTFFGIADSEAAGVPLTPERLPEIRRLGAEICRALEGHDALVHPESGQATLGGVIFTGPPQSPDAHLRAVSVTPDGACERSGLTGASAVMAVLNAMGLLEDGQEFVQEGLLALPARGRVARLARVGEIPAIVAEIEASAWITAEQTLMVDDDDPLAEGYVI